MAGQVAAALVALVAGQVVGVRRVEGVSGLVLAIVVGLLALTQFAANQAGGLRACVRNRAQAGLSLLIMRWIMAT